MTDKKNLYFFKTYMLRLTYKKTAFSKSGLRYINVISLFAFGNLSNII